MQVVQMLSMTLVGISQLSEAERDRLMAAVIHHQLRDRDTQA